MSGLMFIFAQPQSMSFKDRAQLGQKGETIQAGKRAKLKSRLPEMPTHLI